MLTITVSGDQYTIKQLTDAAQKALAVAFGVAQHGANETTDKLLALALMAGILAGDIETNGATAVDKMLKSIAALA